MRSISKAQQQDIEKAINACSATAQRLEDAIEEYNAAMAPHRERIEAALEAYNETVTDLRSTYTDIASAARDYYSDRTEKWQESEAGQAYSEWADQLEDPEGIEDLEFELPEELAVPDFPDWEDDSWLPPQMPSGG